MYVLTRLRWSNRKLVRERGSQKRSTCCPPSSPSPLRFVTRAASLTIDWRRVFSIEMVVLPRRVLGTHLVIVSWDIRSRELSKIVFSQRREHAFLQRVIIRDDIAHIYRPSRVSGGAMPYEAS